MPTTFVAKLTPYDPFLGIRPDVEITGFESLDETEHLQYMVDEITGCVASRSDQS